MHLSPFPVVPVLPGLQQHFAVYKALSQAFFSSDPPLYPCELQRSRRVESVLLNGYMASAVWKQNSHPMLDSQPIGLGFPQQYFSSASFLSCLQLLASSGVTPEC